MQNLKQEDHEVDEEDSVSIVCQEMVWANAGYPSTSQSIK